jgi:glycosyltransferase involved in cell wall biosynthesis
MKVALASHGIHPDLIGGMERHTFSLAKNLQARGCDVSVLVPEPDRGTVFPFPVVHLPWPKRPIWLWSNYDFSRHVGNWIDVHRPDVAFGQGFGLWSYLPRRKIPCVFHPHGLEMFGDHLRPHERFLLAPFRRIVRYHAAHSDRTISLGGKLTEILVRDVGVSADRVIEIPNAVEMDQFPITTGIRRKDSFLFVGRLAFNKGIDLLSDAVHATRDLNYSLTIAGDGPCRKMVERLANGDPRVSYIPKATEAELHRLYAEHEALVFTSRFEGMPTVILEAMAAGACVLATRIGAVEVLVSEETGLLMDPSARGIAAGLRRFLAIDKPELNRRVEEARRRVDRSFSWPSVTGRYLDLLGSLIRT